MSEMSDTKNSGKPASQLTKQEYVAAIILQGFCSGRNPGEIGTKAIIEADSLAHRLLEKPE